MLGRVVVEREQYVEVVGDLRGGLGPLGAVLGHERGGRGFGVFLVFGVPDLGEGLLRARVGRLRQCGKDIAGLVEPAPLLARVREHVSDRLPEPQRTVPDSQHRGAHPPPFAVTQQVGPRLGRLAEPVGQGDQLLGALGADPDHHQQADLVGVEADLDVDPVDP